MTTRTWIPVVLTAALPLTATAATLEERVEALERREVHLYQTREGRTEAGLESLISERISLAGLVEVEAYFENLTFEGDEADENASDLVLATVQLGFEAKINDNLDATIILLYEEEEDAVIEVDEATLDYHRDVWFARLGRQYVPFGVYPSHMVSDPITLNLGETQETGLLLGYAQEAVAVSLWAANGDAEHHNGVGHINDWGVSLTLNPMDFLELGGSFHSDLADTDAELVANYRERVPGWSVYAVVGAGPVEFSGEVLGAAKAFHENDLDVDADGSGDRPMAWNLEASAEVFPAVEFAGRVEGSQELADEPQLQVGLCLSWGPWDNVSTSLEYLRGEFDEEFSGGVESRNRVTAQLAAEF